MAISENILPEPTFFVLTNFEVLKICMFVTEKKT